MSNERGSVALVSMCIVSLLALLSVAVTAHAEKIDDLSEARTLANEAARIGAQELDEIAFLTDNTIAIDPVRAERSVVEFLRQRSSRESVELINFEVTQDRVTVELVVQTGGLLGGQSGHCCRYRAR